MTKNNKAFLYETADENYIPVFQLELNDLIKFETLKKTSKHKFKNANEMAK